MGANFLRKLFRQPAELPADAREAIVDLAKLAQERPAIAAPANLLADIFPGLYDQPISETPPAISTEQAAAKLAGGIPLLRGETIDVDMNAFRRRALHACAAVERQQNEATAAILAQAFERGQLDPRELVPQLLAGHSEAIHARADALELDAALAATVLRLTLFPVFSHIRTAISSFVANTRWQHGYCPVCGCWPLLGEFRGLEQIRFLRCGLCAVEWEFPRLCCPFCENTDHRQLGYFHVEAEEAKYRAATCDACHGYVKMAATLFALNPPQLLVTDVATLHLDLAASDRGYHGGDSS